MPPHIAMNWNVLVTPRFYTSHSLSNQSSVQILDNARPHTSSSNYYYR